MEAGRGARVEVPGWVRPWCNCKFPANIVKVALTAIRNTGNVARPWHSLDHTRSNLCGAANGRAVFAETVAGRLASCILRNTGLSNASASGHMAQAIGSGSRSGSGSSSIVLVLIVTETGLVGGLSSGGGNASGRDSPAGGDVREAATGRSWASEILRLRFVLVVAETSLRSSFCSRRSYASIGDIMSSGEVLVLRSACSGQGRSASRECRSVVLHDLLNYRLGLCIVSPSDKSASQSRLWWYCWIVSADLASSPQPERAGSVYLGRHYSYCRMHLGAMWISR